MKPLILASSSVYRKALLARLQLPFTTLSPHVDETAQPNETPENLVKRLALTKAQAAATQHPDAIAIGADTLATCEGSILGKPLTHDVAVKQLQQIRGKAVTFHTGLSVVGVDPSFQDVRLIPTTVTFRNLTDHMIENYLQKEKPYFSSASFKSETLGSALISHFSGDDPTAIIGLPLIALCEMLSLAGLAVL